MRRVRHKQPVGESSGPGSSTSWNRRDAGCEGGLDDHRGRFRVLPRLDGRSHWREDFMHFDCLPQRTARCGREACPVGGWRLVRGAGALLRHLRFQQAPPGQRMAWRLPCIRTAQSDESRFAPLCSRTVIAAVLEPACGPRFVPACITAIAWGEGSKLACKHQPSVCCRWSSDSEPPCAEGSVYRECVLHINSEGEVKF